MRELNSVEIEQVSGGTFLLIAGILGAIASSVLGGQHWGGNGSSVNPGGSWGSWGNGSWGNWGNGNWGGNSGTSCGCGGYSFRG